MVKQQTKLGLCPACNVFGVLILLETDWLSKSRKVKCQSCNQASEVNLRNWKI